MRKIMEIRGNLHKHSHTARSTWQTNKFVPCPKGKVLEGARTRGKNAAKWILIDAISRQRTCRAAFKNAISPSWSITRADKDTILYIDSSVRANTLIKWGSCRQRGTVTTWQHRFFTVRIIVLDNSNTLLPQLWLLSQRNVILSA